MEPSLQSVVRSGVNGSYLPLPIFPPSWPDCRPQDAWRLMAALTETQAVLPQRQQGVGPGSFPFFPNPHGEKPTIKPRPHKLAFRFRLRFGFQVVVTHYFAL